MRLREAAAALPEELLLVETDAPYLAPQPLRGKPNEPAHVVAHGARPSPRPAASPMRSWRGPSRKTRGRSSAGSAWSGSARTSSPTPTCSTRSSATPTLAPADVVLEVGPGEGVLTERLAERVNHVHAIEIDRGLEAALARVRGARKRRPALGRRDAAPTSPALRPAPTAMVANLPYSVATPVLLRTIEQLPSLRALDA